MPDHESSLNICRGLIESLEAIFAFTMTPFLSWVKLDVCFESVDNGTLEVELSEGLVPVLSEMLVVGKSESGQLDGTAVGDGISETSERLRK